MELSSAVVLDAIDGLDKKLDNLIESTKGIETILSKSADEAEVEPEPVEEVVDEKALTADDVGKIVREMVKEAMDELAKPLPRESSVIIESEDEDETESIDSVYDRKEIHKRMSEAVGARLGDR
jgi:predicted transcriptional regulator